MESLGGDYSSFCEMVIAYRRFEVVMAAIECGVIDALEAGPCRLERLLEITGIRAGEGERFVDLLLSSGILRETGGELALSPFSATWLSRGSELGQRGVLRFERQLQSKWQGLGGILLAGQGSRVENLAGEDYRRRLGEFHLAMHGAAAVRSAELWDQIGQLAAEGFIIDAGAGDCTYLRSFLERHSGWRGLACDLADVLAGATEAERLAMHPCNLIDPVERRQLLDSHRGGADLLLLSNFIHCYGCDEVASMLFDLGELVSPGGMLVIHDFFTGANDFSSLYDLHMLVNTMNGRTYSLAEAAEMLGRAGFNLQRTLALPSCSHALVARRKAVQVL